MLVISVCNISSSSGQRRIFCFIKKMHTNSTMFIIGSYYKHARGGGKNIPNFTLDSNLFIIIAKH